MTTARYTLFLRAGLTAALFLCCRTPAEQPTSETIYRPIFQQRLSGDALEKALQEMRLKIEGKRVETFKTLPGGVYNAPALMNQIDAILKTFRKTKYLAPNVLIHSFLASAPDFNAGILLAQEVEGFSDHHLIINKGLTDFLSSPNTAWGPLPPELAAFLQNQEALLAAVIAHEVGHAMHGDGQKHRATTRVYDELDADEFAVKLLAEAGYDPESYIQLMKLIEFTSHATTALELISHFLDEHPKPLFRIASITSLVELLKKERTAKQELGMGGDVRELLPAAPLDHSGKEKTSRGSLASFERELSTPIYRAKSGREKLHFLEQYFILNASGAANPVTAVRATKEYARLVSECTDLDSISVAVSSLTRFEKALGDTVNSSASNSGARPKAHFKRLKSFVTQKQISLLEGELGGKLTPDVLKFWASKLDRQVVEGALVREIKRAPSVEALQTLLHTWQDFSHTFQDRFARPTVGETPIPEAIAVRALYLTGSLEKALDFMQANFTLEKVAQEKLHLDGAGKLLAGLMEAVLQNPKLSIGNFVKRMQDSRTKADRAYSKIFGEVAQASDSELQARWGAREQISDRGELTYGTGTPVVTQSAMTEDLSGLLRMALSPQSFNRIFSAKLKTRYTLSETLDWLGKRSPELGWDTMKAAIQDFDRAHDGDRAKSPREPETNLVRIERALLSFQTQRYPDAVLPDSKSGPYTDLQQAVWAARLAIPQLHRETFFEAVRKTPFGISSSPWYPPEGLVLEIEPAQLKLLDSEAKLDLLELLLRSSAEDRAKRNGPVLQEALPKIEIWMKQIEAHEVYNAQTRMLFDGGTFNEKERLEAFAALEEIFKIAGDYSAGNLTELPSRFYQLQKQLRAQDAILKEPTNFSRRWNHPEIRASDRKSATFLDFAWAAEDPLTRARIVDLIDSPMTNERFGMPLLHQMLAPDRATVAKYLTSESPVENPIWIQDAVRLCRLLRQYGGLDDSIPRGPRETGRMALRSMTGDPEHWWQSFDPKQIFTLATKSNIFGVGPAFTAKWKVSRTDWHDTGIYFAESSLWSVELGRALESEDPIEALVATIASVNRLDKADENIGRIYYSLFRRALAKVRTPMEMSRYVAIFHAFLKSPAARSLAVDTYSDLRSENPMRAVSGMMALRYRAPFLDTLVKKLNQYKVWGSDFYVRRELAAGLSKLTPFKIRTALAIRGALNRLPPSKDTVLRRLRANSPWSEEIDNTIAAHIRDTYLTRGSKHDSSVRQSAVNLTREMRSLTLRNEVYRQILKKFGDPRSVWITRVSNQFALWGVYRKAKKIWSEEFLEEISRVSLLEAALMMEREWYWTAKKRAAKRNVTKEQAVELLVRSYQAKQNELSEAAGEIAGIFQEGSRYRDALLDEYTKRHPTTLKTLQSLESFKSKNVESPLHLLIKGAMEALDTYLAKLAPAEHADVLLYLSGFVPELPPGLQATLEKRYYGADRRRKALKKRGLYLDMADIRLAMNEMHPDERQVAFQSFFLGESGISRDTRAESDLANRLLFSDASMPHFLKRVLEFYLEANTPAERQVMLSWILANQRGKSLTGPEVLKLIVEKGGATAAKLAQLVASHGFELPPAYQEVLQVFKGSAQKVEKIRAMEWLKERLPPHLFGQIESLDEERGSGSLKLAYIATLKDGRRVIVKLGREYIYAKLAREFEIVRTVMGRIMSDPTLRVENLPALEKETERILVDEVVMANELEKVKKHMVADEARPLIVKVFGNSVRILVPKPLEEWQAEGVMVEEYVDSYSFDSLPATSRLGWSKEKMAKGAIREMLNELLAYLNPDEQRAGKIILDIDPHEDNHLAKKGGWFRKTLVDIDFGQSVELDSGVARGFTKLLYAVYRADFDEARALSRDYMKYSSPADEIIFDEELRRQADATGDPLEALTHALSVLELKGIQLKPEYLFFQKLFATVVGLKSHVPDKDFITQEMKKGLLLRRLALGKRALDDFPGAIRHEVKQQCPKMFARFFSK